MLEALAMALESTRSVVVATHGHCFDGMCSAALFTRLLRELGAKGASYAYRSCGYGPQQGGVDPALLVGDQNAILDFRYTASPRLGWYFDHHKTAFASGEDRDDFLADGGEHKFHDDAYGSCTKLVHDVSRAKFGLDEPAHIAELVRWAEVIDAARFPSAEMAVAREEPALWLMTVAEHHGDDAFLAQIVPLLLERPLDEVARLDWVVQRWLPLRAAHEAFVTKVRATSTVLGSVVYVDLTGEVIDVAGKFVTYALFPSSAYSVMVSRGKTRCKISVGYNPWSGVERRHDISAICSRHGGGGHPVVGAIALSPGDILRAQALALEIARELDGP